MSREPPALFTCTDSLGRIPRISLLAVNAPAERRASNLSTSPYLRQGRSVKEKHPGEGVRRPGQCPARGWRGPAGGGAPARPSPPRLAEPPLRALPRVAARMGMLCEARPALPLPSPTFSLLVLAPHMEGCLRCQGFSTWAAAAPSREAGAERMRGHRHSGQAASGAKCFATCPQARGNPPERSQGWG